MNILLIFSGFIVAFIIVLCYEYKIRHFRQRNKVHFYVARDKTGELYLYLGKPFRGDVKFYDNPEKGIVILSYNFHKYGLNKNDYANLKWENEPIEVFLNMEE